jgi:hypothetical protein
MVLKVESGSNALATETNKLRRNMKVSDRCKICEDDMEDGAHALCHFLMPGIYGM